MTPTHLRSFVVPFMLATLVACQKPKAEPTTESSPSATAESTPTAPAQPAANPGAPIDPGALYALDTDPQPAPPPSSGLARVLKGLHLRVCVRADAAPFGAFASGGLEGFEIELAREIVQTISIDYKQALRPEWTVVTAGERMKRLQDDGCDLMIASFSHTPERANELALSKVYLRTDKVLLAQQKVTRKVPIIAKVGGTTGGDSAGVKGTERTFGSYQEIVYAMDMDEIDYLVTDRPIAEHLIRSSTRPFVVQKTIAEGAESYVAATAKTNPELLAAVDRALETLARSGRLAHLHRRWL